MANSDYIARNKVGNLVPVEYYDEIFKAMRAESVVMANARRLRDMERHELALTVEDALPIAYFTNGDTGFRDVTKAEWKGVTVTAEEVNAIIPVPNNLIDDMDVPIWQEVMPMLAQAIRAKVDIAQLLGTGKPATWPTAIISEANTRSHVVTVPNSSPDYYDLIMGDGGVIAKVEEDGYFVSGHVGNIKLRSKLRGIRDEVGQPIFQPSMQGSAQYQLDGAPMFFSRNGALTADVLDIAGDWNQLVYSVRKDITYDIFREGVISDPTTKLVVTNLMQQRMTAIMVTMRLGFALPNPVNMVQPDGTARYPFAVLKGTASASS